MPFSEFIQNWWPLPTSLDLVRGETEAVASAVLAEVARFVEGEQLSGKWVPFDSLANVFASVEEFTTVPTVFYVLPTHSEWSVLWNNSFQCTGYDSLCWCITSNHRMETIHWQSSNEDAVFQAGSLFTARRWSEAGMAVRSVYCCKSDARWDFYSSGEPLVEEDTASYAAQRKRDRLNEGSMMALLSRLRAQPWEESFYRDSEAFRIERVAFPPTIRRKKFAEFAHKRG